MLRFLPLWLVDALTDRRVTGRLCSLVVLVFLIAGWWPFNPFPRNQVTWLAPGPGLAFRPDAIAYDAQPLPGFAGGNHPAVFTIELSIEAALVPSNNVYHVLTIDNGRLPSGFVLCQWKSHLILRSPDASRPRGFREASVAGLDAGRRRNMAIVSDGSGTNFHVDGKLVQRYPTFTVPADVFRGRLILGNAASGKHSWSGRIFSLAIYNRALARPELERASAPAAGPSAADDERLPGLVAAYAFAERGGSSAADRSEHRHRLSIPGRYEVLHAPILTPASMAALRDRSRRSDVVINVLGFIPFGFIAYLYRSSKGVPRWGWAARIIQITALGAMLSLLIELVQVWLPNRDSSALDLVCNTAGGFLGVLLAAALVGLMRGPRG